MCDIIASMVTEAYRKYQREYQANYYKKYPYRKKANGLVRQRLLYGILEKQEKCFICRTNRRKVIKHHENYAYPGEIIWLCGRCHKRRHKYLASIGWIDCVKRPEKSILPNMVQPKDLMFVLDDETKEAMDNLFSKAKFTYREREAMKLRATKFTYEEIGRVFKLSRERIRQILINAERKYDFAQKLSCNL